MELVSIIVPIYNSEEKLKKCITTLVNQSFKNIEIILVNDGSTDSSLNICQYFSNIDGRVKIVNQRNKGVSAARNAGIKVAKGNLITFVDSDDYVYLDMIEKLVNYIKDFDVDLVYLGQYKEKKKQLREIPERIRSGIYDSRELMDNIIDDGTMSGFLLHSACAVMYKKNILINSNITFNVKVKYNEDGLFNFEYLLNSKKIYIDQGERVYVYLENLNSSSYKSFDNPHRFTELHKILRTYSIKFTDYKIAEQLKRRDITLLVSDISRLTSHPFKKAIVDLRMLINGTKTQENIIYIEPKKLSLNKKIIYILIKNKNVIPTYLYFKYVRQTLKRILSK